MRGSLPHVVDTLRPAVVRGSLPHVVDTLHPLAPTRETEGYERPYNEPSNCDRDKT